MYKNQEKYKNMNKKEARISESNREKLQTPCNMHGLIKHLITKIKHIQYLNVQIQSRQKRPNECIRKGEVLVHINSVYKR